MSRRVFCGNLPNDATENELHRIFRRYGPLERIDMKKGGFAFVEFCDDRDAAYSTRYEDNQYFYNTNYRLRVELASGARDDRRDRDRDRDRDRGRDRGAQSQTSKARTPYRLIATGLPRGADWASLKDAARPYHVAFADVKNDYNRSRGECMGLLEFSREDDMNEALRALNGQDLRGKPLTLQRESPEVSWLNSAASGEGGDRRNNAQGRGGAGERKGDRDRRGGGGGGGGGGAGRGREGGGGAGAGDRDRGDRSSRSRSRGRGGGAERGGRDNEEQEESRRESSSSNNNSSSDSHDATVAGGERQGQEHSASHEEGRGGGDDGAAASSSAAAVDHDGGDRHHTSHHEDAAAADSSSSSSSSSSSAASEYATAE